MAVEYDAKERRISLRYRYTGHVKVEQTSRGWSASGMTVDLSLEGCLIVLEASSLLTQGTELEMSFTTSYLAFRTCGSLRSCRDEGRLLGIQFHDLSRRGRADIEELLLDRKAALAAKRATVR